MSFGSAAAQRRGGSSPGPGEPRREPPPDDLRRGRGLRFWGTRGSGTVRTAVVAAIVAAIAVATMRKAREAAAARRTRRQWLEWKRNYPPLSTCVPEEEEEGKVSGTNARNSPLPAATKTLARKSQNQVMEIPEHYYKSQFQEDKKLMTWFGTLCGGTYLEMGGLDGVFFSNSFVFNKALSWKGVLIELNGSNYDEMKDNRPNEIATVHAGVCKSAQKLHAVDDGPTGGIYEFASPTYIAKWWGDLSFDDPKVKEIDCDTLDSILREHAPATTYFDFFSLDVEGAELTALESVDFDRVGFGVIVVESAEYNERKNLVVRRLLERKGYTFLYPDKRNYWFANNNFDEIYKHLVY